MYYMYKLANIITVTLQRLACHKSLRSALYCTSDMYRLVIYYAKCMSIYSGTWFERPHQCAISWQPTLRVTNHCI